MSVEEPRVDDVSDGGRSRQRRARAPSSALFLGTIEELKTTQLREIVGTLRLCSARRDGGHSRCRLETWSAPTEVSANALAGRQMASAPRIREPDSSCDQTRSTSDRRRRPSPLGGRVPRGSHGSPVLIMRSVPSAVEADGAPTQEAHAMPGWRARMDLALAAPAGVGAKRSVYKYDR